MLSNNRSRKILKRNIHYGFLTEEKLPKVEFIEHNLTNESDWVITGEYKEFAKNHCATVCAANLTIFFRATRDDKNKIFMDIYKYMGNGPKIDIGYAMKKYFKDLDYDLKLKNLKSPGELKKSLDDRKPVILLLAGSLINWHWVLVTGYRIYGDEFYLKIVDGWHRIGRTYYKPGVGSKILLAIQCGLNKKN
ncbi:putative membrane protein [Peptoniphilus sp. ING2-D1G]|nr:putative membrane protein [Peptoniphilus sp. ING2-D1G]